MQNLTKLKHIDKITALLFRGGFIKKLDNPENMKHGQLLNHPGQEGAQTCLSYKLDFLENCTAFAKNGISVLDF